MFATAGSLSYLQLVTTGYRPLFDLSISTPDLTLRPMREADLGPISDLLPDDLELDPAATRYEISDELRSRGIITHQGHWKAYGTWSPSVWQLGFVVTSGGQVAGFQELEGNDFILLRTVDTSSFLIEAARGSGVGKQMRRAVLALAFGPLGRLRRSRQPGTTTTPRSASRARLVTGRTASPGTPATTDATSWCT